MVPAVSDRIPRVPPYSGAPLVTASLPVRGCHPLRPAFPDRSGSLPFLYVKSYYPGCAVTLPVWALSVSIATTPDIDVSFSSCRYLDVSVPCVRPVYMPVSVLQTDGLPHSDISGSTPVCSSPELFAAYHVLLRLREPRHPPYALFCFLCLSRLEIVSFRPLLFTSLSVSNIVNELPLDFFRPSASSGFASSLLTTSRLLRRSELAFLAPDSELSPMNYAGFPGRLPYLTKKTGNTSSPSFSSILSP